MVRGGAMGTGRKAPPTGYAVSFVDESCSELVDECAVRNLLSLVDIGGLLLRDSTKGSKGPKTRRGAR